MSETRKEIREDRAKRTQLNRDTNNLIADNGLDGKVRDIYEILETSNDPIAIKLRMLEKYGITKEMIVMAYGDMTGNVENRETAMDSLAAVFKQLAIYLNQQPNGIVIDLVTGELNEKASYRQAIKAGIFDESYAKNLQKLGTEKTIKEIIENKRTVIEENKYINNTSKYMINFFSNKDYEDYENGDLDTFNISQNSIEVLKNAKKIINEKDSKKMELLKIEADIDDSVNSPFHEAHIKKREKFLKENPEYENLASQIRDKNGNIKPEFAEEYKEYNDCIKIKCILTGISMFNDKNKNIESLNPEERKTLITTALAGLKKDDISKGLISADCWDIIYKLNPSLRNAPKEDKYAFFQKELELDEQLNTESFKNLIDISNQALEKSIPPERYKNDVDKKHRKISDDKVMNRFFSDTYVNLKCEFDNRDKTDFEKYFDGSKIDFTSEDEKEFNETYKNCTVESWIDNKEEALILKYATLIRTKENLESFKNTEENEKSTRKFDFANKRLEEINKEMIEFKEKYPNLQCENEDGSLKDDIINKAEIYKNKMIEASLLKFYSVDVLKQLDGKGYEGLDFDHRKAYLRNILVGLNYGKESKNSSIEKMAQRRLELLNSDSRTFIMFDSEGNAIIDEEQILKEYNIMTNKKWDSYDELLDSSEARKDDYILKKLNEYEKLDEKDFIKLDSPNDYENSLNQIENIRVMSNQRQNDTRRDDISISEIDFQNETIQENNEIQEENSNTNNENSIFDKLKNVVTNFKNRLNPRLTDGKNAENKKGFFSTIISKIKRNDENNINNINSNTISHSDNEIVTDLKQDNENKWKVDKVTGKIDYSQVDNSNITSRDTREDDEEQIY